jgi:excinuclease ABC subunit A
MLYAENFSPNRPEGACPKCHGLGRIYTVTEQSMVPDPALTIRQRAIAAWPTAWQGQNQRDILVTLGYNVDRPWRELPKKDRDWILFTDEQPTVPVYAGFTPAETRRALRSKTESSYMGTFTSARRYVLETFSKTQSAMMKRRVSAFMLSAECSVCHGKRLRADALEVRFAGLDIGALGALPLQQVHRLLAPYANTKTSPLRATPDEAAVALRITQDIVARLDALLLLGLGYLALERSAPTLSPGELQRLRLATQMHSNLCRLCS